MLAAESKGGGSFLVSPGLGLMIWTLIAFGASMLILQRYAFPRIAEALEKRSRLIQDSIDHAEQMRKGETLTPALTAARLCLFRGVQTVIRNGLAILGVSALERM